jgi:type I restriction enzyme S subunit
MNKDKKLIPELRFPECINEGEWEIKEVGEIFEVTRGYVLSMSLVHEEKSEENLYPVFSSQTKNNGLAGFYGEYLYEDAITWTTDGANAGDVNYRNGKFYCTNVCGVLINKNGFANKCIAELINSVSKKYVSYVGNPKLMNGVMSQIKIPIPTISEQQKIASCLSSLDEIIAAHSKKLELLKEHKKGLMQNLFPQEGEKVPKLRFKEFEGDGEWIPTTVEDNCLVKGRIGYRGYTTEDLVGQGEGAFVLGGKHIQNQILELKDPTYLSWEKYYESPEIMVEVGDIIFSQRGTLGDCAIIDREIGPATINPSMVLLKNITCNAGFLYYILIGDSIQIEVQKNRAMGAIPMLSQKQIREFPFFIPRNPVEQQKIASFLSSLDVLIAAQAEKIEQLKLHKKGLMQGLFPKIND